MAKGYVFRLQQELPKWHMVRLVVARPNARHQHFEVVVDADAAMAFRQGLVKDVRDVLQSQDIFTDAKKGLRPSEAELKAAFGTLDKLKIAEDIVRRGIIQETAEQRAQKMAALRAQVIDLIRRFCVDGRTGLPLPPQRIENAIEERKVKIDYARSAEEQLQEIIRALQPALPLRYELKQFEVHTSVNYASKAQALLRRLGMIKQQRWEPDGSFCCVLELPSGLQQEFFDQINGLTHGQAVIKPLERR